MSANEKKLQHGKKHVSTFFSLFMALSEIWIRQAKSWMMHASLVDPHGEFILSKSETGQGLAVDKIPCFISKETAESILFIGNTVKTLKQRNIPIEFDFPSDATHWRLFESSVSHLKSIVSKKCHSILLVDMGFMHLVQDLRNVMLLGRGDVFSDWMLALNKVKRQTTARLALMTVYGNHLYKSIDLNHAFKQVLNNIGEQDHFSGFTLSSIKPSGVDAQGLGFFKYSI